MDFEDILLQCMLCPGYCSYICPVFRDSYVRASAPVNIARGLYRFVKYGDEKFLMVGGYCSLCGKCVETCPVKNPLPEAVKEVRRVSSRSIGATIGMDEGYLGIFIPRDINVDFGVLREYGIGDIKVIDSDELYHEVSFGYMDRISLERGYNEDVDVFKNGYSIELLNRLNRRLNMGEYFLHIPCKLDEGYVDQYIEVFGEPLGIIRGCVGGGGIDILAPDITVRLLKKFVRLEAPIISQCGRAVRILRRNGIEAYTPFEVDTKWRR